MALTDFTFRLGDNGLVLNDDSLSTPFVDITEVRGLDSAPFRETSRDHEGVDGGFMDAEFEKARPIVMVGNIYGEAGELEPYLDQLKANYAPSRNLVPFYFKAPNSGEKVCLVKPQGVRYDWQTDRRLGIVRVQFLVFAEDPRIYDSELKNIDMQLSGFAVDGFSFPLAFPLTFGVTNEFGFNVATLTNSGNRSTPVEFTIFGPANGPKIINDVTGDILQFDIDLSAVDTLVINSYYRTVRLNGSLNRRNTLREPNWFDLAPGNNTLRYFVEFPVSGLFDPIALNPNPFFEIDTSNWTPAGGTFVRSTTKFHEGVASGLLTPDGVTATVNVHTGQVPVKVGTPYKLSTWLNCDVARTVNVQILWFTGTGSFLSVNTFGAVLLANTWTLAENTYVAPAQAELAWLQIEMFTTPPASHLLYIDEAKILKPLESSVNVKFRSAWR